MRKLNLDEKRRIEKLMFADIEAKKGKYKAKREKEKDELVERLNKSIPAEIRKAFADYKKVEKEMQEKEEFIKSRGYAITGWDDKKEVEVSKYDEKPPEVKEFDKETERTEKKLEVLKREFTLKLYAANDETQKLFNELMKKLEATVRAD